ncbi:hypothetical protein [Paraburkholderia xenovorans]|uniref:hypothetical protein n=1 Tax=Paraburkholderia xenovorans TaxID=36873 RepID=UPI0038BC1E43
MSFPQSSAPDTTPKLGAALRQRHVTMIALGGIIGAGLFVGSSATLATVGPAACVSYLVAGIVVLMVIRMLGAIDGERGESRGGVGGLYAGSETPAQRWHRDGLSVANRPASI